MKLRMLLLLTAVVATSALAIDSSRHVRNRVFIRQDSEVTSVETPPHNGTGKSTAYRYFDDVKDAKIIFRKRTLHKGASIGMHILGHDEVYYVVSGNGKFKIDDVERNVGPSTAIFMHEGADVGIWQTGANDLVLIISYPPETPAPAPTR